MTGFPPPSKALAARLRKLSSRKGREENQRFLVEGPHLVKECLLSGLVPRNLILSDEASDSIRSELEQIFIIHKNISCWTLPHKEFISLCGTITPQGVLGEFDQPRQLSWDLFGEWQHPKLAQFTSEGVTPGGQPIRIVVLDSIQEPGNVGTAIRCSAGLGANAIVLTCGCADIWNPKSLRASVGAIFRVPIWANIPHSTLEQRLQTLNSTIWVADPRGKSIFECKVIPNPLILVLGNEARGPGSGWSGMAGARTIGIPLSHGLESLNVGTALAALLSAISAIESGQGCNP